MVVPDGFRLQESRPAALDDSLVKCGVLLIAKLGMGWSGGLITRKSQERTKAVHDYVLPVCVHLEAHQRTPDFPNWELPSDDENGS